MVKQMLGQHSLAFDQAFMFFLFLQNNGNYKFIRLWWIAGLNTTQIRFANLRRAAQIEVFAQRGMKSSDLFL
jgi:hypothetical protein